MTRDDDDPTQHGRRIVWGRDDRGGVGSDQEEPANPSVEQSCVAPLEVESDCEHGVDDRKAGEVGHVGQDSRVNGRANHPPLRPAPDAASRVRRAARALAMAPVTTPRGTIAVCRPAIPDGRKSRTRIRIRKGTATLYASA